MLRGGDAAGTGVVGVAGIATEDAEATGVEMRHAGVVAAGPLLVVSQMEEK
jgi:hypothetical protein